ncbi:YsnF/AvaK domain-containing protein [Salipaludibacillus sp. HK11]|uniref:YsnF/AvaK domain-containing protein n=1 Tax=Salipaludibacillus sp. HK11 TaxID=3394320 RepID=UPI0039FD892B
MSKYILIGAVIGLVFSLVLNISLLEGLFLGTALGGISYKLYRLYSGEPNTPKEEASQTKNQTIRLKEEQLDISKNQVQTGDIKVHKEVSEQQKTFTVPIRREEMVVEAGDEEEFRIPLKEEEIEISKHPVKVNEVSLSKREIEEIEQVKGMVKKEKAYIEKKEGADVKVNDMEYY